MNLLLVTDIFGRTKAVDELARSFNGEQISIEIFDPYNRQYRNFESEDKAYRTFQKEIGLGNYTHLLKQELANGKPTETILLGFSVGASAIWGISQDIGEGRYKGICFYSSQVRNFLDIEPKIDVELYFAKSEPSYDVDKISEYLAKKANVTCWKTNYLHGFMNKESTHFNKEGYAHYLEIIKNFIASQVRQTR